MADKITLAQLLQGQTPKIDPVTYGPFGERYDVEQWTPPWPNLDAAMTLLAGRRVSPLALSQLFSLSAAQRAQSGDIDISMLPGSPTRKPKPP